MSILHTGDEALQTDTLGNQAPYYMVVWLRVFKPVCTITSIEVYESNASIPDLFTIQQSCIVPTTT